MRIARKGTPHCGVLFGWQHLQWRKRRERGKKKERKKDKKNEGRGKGKKNRTLLVVATSLRAVAPSLTRSKAQN
jgi:hypothetical protein